MSTKIKNLRIARTVKQDSDAWAEVLSLRNKLLANSDWTQLPDSGLTPANVRLWGEWRRQLKRVNRRNVADRDTAKANLQVLTNTEPKLAYEDETLLLTEADDITVKSVNSRKEYVLRLLNEKFNALLRTDMFESNSMIVDEEFEEAMLYNGTTVSPLIALECELTGKTPEEVVASFITAKRTRIRNIIVLKRKFKYFKDLVTSSSSMLHLKTLEGEIRAWTLIST